MQHHVYFWLKEEHRNEADFRAFEEGMSGLLKLKGLLGGFWAVLKLVTGLWAAHHGLLVGLVLLVNGITAFSLARFFGLIFAGQPQPMTVRSPEPIWLMVVPMMLGVGFTLHLPLILQVLGLMPTFAGLNMDMALVLTWASVIGLSLGALLYGGRLGTAPDKLMPKSIQNLLAFDFYTPRLYRLSVVLGVDRLSRLTDWLDRYLVDGLVNFVGLASLLSGETLKYNNSGRFQFYVLTISLCVAVISIVMSWHYLPSVFTAAFSRW